MSKFSISAEIRAKMREVYNALAFHQRHIKRIDNEMNAFLTIELQRTGSLGREVKNIDLEKGEIEVGDIIKPVEQAPKIEVATK